MKPPPRVALLIESSRTYGRGILRGIARYAHTQGPWSCFIQERELHSGIPGWLRDWQGDGIIARIENRRMAKALLAVGCPVVDVLGNEEFPDIPAFDTDASRVARLAADFFLAAGFRHFAYCGYPGIPFSDRRRAAFVECLAAADCRVSVFGSRAGRQQVAHIQVVEQRGLEAEAAVAEWLQKLPRPLALFACNDIRAQQVLNICRQQDIQVPEEVAVMGVDNDDVLCNLCDPPLTSIEPDTERLGFEAARLLERMMRGRSSARRVTQIPPLRLEERTSTDVVAVEDAIVVSAFRFIRDHVGEGIAVKDVQAQVGRSRTDLERRFHRWLKCSVRAEIQRRRMDRVCTLLRQTNLGLGDIVAQSGFSTAAHLCRVFQRQFKESPGKYRLRIK